MPKQYLKVREVAKLLGVTPLTIRNWDARGKLTAHRHPFNNYRMYKVEEVENLMKELELSKNFIREPKKISPPPVKKLKIDVL